MMREQEKEENKTKKYIAEAMSRLRGQRAKDTAEIKKKDGIDIDPGIMGWLKMCWEWS